MNDSCERKKLSCSMTKKIEKRGNEMNLVESEDVLETSLTDSISRF